MTKEAYAEYEYRYNERLGMLCGKGEPSPAQMEEAKKEAEAAVKELGFLEQKELMV